MVSVLTGGFQLWPRSLLGWQGTAKQACGPDSGSRWGFLCLSCSNSMDNDSSGDISKACDLYIGILL